MLKESSYGSDLSDRQWRLVEELLPKPKKRGRKPTDRRWVVDAILYVAVTGCQWRQLPHDFPHWKTVYNTFWAWRRDGVIERVHEALREKARKAAGKKPTPSVAIVDSQSVRTGEGGEQRGYDAHEEDHRPQAARRGGYARVGDDGRGSFGQPARPRRAERIDGELVEHAREYRVVEPIRPQSRLARPSVS